MEKLRKIFATGLLIGMMMSSLYGKNTNGTGGGAWNVGSTWSDGIVPTSSDNVTILAGDIVTNNADTRCLDLTVHGTLSCSSGMFLRISGNYTISSTGSETGSAGSIAFIGGSAATISFTNSFSSAIIYIFYKNMTISSTTTMTRTAVTNIFCNGTTYINTTVTNQGNVTLKTVNSYATSTWVNDVNSSLTLTVSGFMSTSGAILTANATGNTVTYAVSNAGETLKNPTAGYYNLTLSGGTGKTLAADLTVLNNFTLSTSTPLTAGSYTLNIGGNFTLSGGSFVQGTSTVNMNGSGSQSISGTGTFNFYNLTQSGSGTTTLGKNVTVSNLLTVSGGVLNASTYGITGTGGLTMTNGELQLAKLSTTLPELSGSYSLSGGTITFNGAGSQTLRTISYYSVNIAGSGTKVPLAAMDVNGNLTISSTLDVTASNYGVSCAGNFINNGTFTQRSGTVTFDGTSTISGSTATTFYNVTISGTLTGHATSMNVSRDFVNNGTYYHNSGTVVFSGTTTVSGSVAPNFNNITISGTLTGHATSMNVAGNFTNNGTFTHNSGTIALNGSGTQSISGSGSITFYNLTQNGSGTTTLAKDITVNNLLTISAGVFNASTYGLSGAGGLTMINGELQLAKLSTTLPELAGSYSLGGGKVTFNGAGSQTIKNTSYFNLDVLGSGTKTAGGALDINGALTISSTLDMSGSNYALNCAGNFINNGTFTPRSGTVTFDGTSTVSGSTTTNFNNITLTGTLTGHATDMNIAGNFDNNGTFTHNSGNVTFNGTTTIGGSTTTTFNNITISGTLTGHSSNINIAGNFANNGTYSHNSGSVTFNGNTTISGSATTTFNDVTISGTLVGHSTNLNIAGDFTNNGTFTHNSGTITFNGGAAQAIASSGTTTFNNLTIQNTGGVTLNSGSYELLSLITIDNCDFNTNGQSFTLLSGASQTASIAPVVGSGSITGNITTQRYISPRSMDWIDLACPVSGSTMADWDATLFLSYPHDPYGGPSVYSNVLAYDETVADYVGVSAATALTPGTGFEIYLTDDANLTGFTACTLSTTGTPVYGDQVINLSYTSENGIWAGQNLVGNPFASAITVQDITFTNALTTVDVYDNTTDNYETLSGTDIIASGQGFWAYATSSGASITVSEAAKSNNLTTDLRSLKQNGTQDSFFKLTISSADASNLMAHTLKIDCNEAASDGWDNKDHPFKRSPNKKAPYITTSVDNIDLSINTFNSQHDEYTLPLNTKVGSTGKYQIGFSNVPLMLSKYKYITLEDKALNKTISINTNTSYQFLANENDSKDRFVLHFSNTEITSVNEIVDFEKHMQVIQNKTGSTINFNFETETISTINVTSVLGQNIIQEQSIKALNQSVNIDLPSNFHGVYLIKISSPSGNVIKKFIQP